MLSAKRDQILTVIHKLAESLGNARSRQECMNGYNKGMKILAPTSVFIGILTLFGCASKTQVDSTADFAEQREMKRAAYEKKLNSWEGKTIAAVIDELGVPQSSFKYENGTQLIEYYESRNIILPLAAAGSIPMSVPVHQYCRTTFSISKANIVQSVKYKGNWCY